MKTLVGTAPMRVIITDSGTDSPLAVEVITDFRKDCELVGLGTFGLVVHKTD